MGGLCGEIHKGGGRRGGGWDRGGGGESVGGGRGGRGELEVVEREVDSAQLRKPSFLLRHSYSRPTPASAGSGRLWRMDSRDERDMR